MRYLTGLITLLQIVLLCSACATSPDRIAPETLAGDWVASEQQPGQGQVDTYMQIRRDGTFDGSLQINAKTVWTFGGRWTLAGKDITWEYTRSSLVLLDEDRAEVDTILQLQGNELQLSSARHGTVRTLQRAR